MLWVLFDWPLGEKYFKESFDYIKRKKRPYLGSRGPRPQGAKLICTIVRKSFLVGGWDLSFFVKCFSVLPWSLSSTGALKPYMGKSKSQISLTWWKQNPKERAGQEREPCGLWQGAACVSNPVPFCFVNVFTWFLSTAWDMERTLCPHLGQSSVGTQHSGGEPDSSSQEVIYRKAGSLSLGRSQAEGVQPRFCWGTWRHSQRSPGMDPLKDCPWAHRVWPGLMWLWCYWESRSPELQKPRASCLHKHFNLHWTHGLGRAVDFTPIFGKKKQAQRNKVHGVTAHLKQPQVLKEQLGIDSVTLVLPWGAPSHAHSIPQWDPGTKQHLTQHLLGEQNQSLKSDWNQASLKENQEKCLV